MGSSTSNSVKIKQEVQNNLMSLNNNQCFSTTGVSASNNNVFFIGGSAKNLTGVEIKGNLNSSCSINQQVVQSATSILKSQAQQTAQTANDLFNDGVLNSKTKNSSSVMQSIINNFSNISSNTCNAQIAINANNNNVVAMGTSVDNFVGVSINSNANATCAIMNLSSQDAYNQQQASVDQDAKSTGMFVAIFMAVITCVMIIVIVIVIIFAMGGLGVLLHGGKKSKTDADVEKENVTKAAKEEFVKKILDIDDTGKPPEPVSEHGSEMSSSVSETSGPESETSSSGSMSETSKSGSGSRSETTSSSYVTKPITGKTINENKVNITNKNKISV